MLDPGLTAGERAKLVEILDAGLEVDRSWLARGPIRARKVLLGEFELEDPSRDLHISNVKREADRTTINSATDSGYDLRWEREGRFVRVYYDPNQKAAL